jgi:His/Glu/Gln/Arg/opine family amino acid ABC transporter permease subunit
MEGLNNVVATFFNVHLIADTLPDLLRVGLPNTLILSVIGTFFACVIGLFCSFGLMSKRFLVRLPFRIYVAIFLGAPHMLSIFLIGAGLPLAGLMVFGRWTYGYAGLAVGVVEGAYMAEIFRSGFQDVDKGVVEAARSLGISFWKTTRLVVVPIGVRTVLPALTGQSIIVIRSTALVYLLGLTIDQRELFSIGHDATINSANFSPLVASGIVYLMITIPLTYIVNAWERHLHDGPRIRLGVSEGG